MPRPSSPLVLRPADVVIALQLALTPEPSFPVLAQATGLSLSEGHKAVRRLATARLLRPDRRAVSPPALLTFLIGGVPYAYPAALGPETRGVPTAHAAPPLADLLWPGGAPPDPVVWPSATGAVRGAGLPPLYPYAPALPGRNPALYALLVLTDALRLGRARERALARDLLQELLRRPHRPADERPADERPADGTPVHAPAAGAAGAVGGGAA